MNQLTILLPVYNEDRYILETLKSIQSQNYKDFKCIISDNKSTDNTGEICQEFAKKDDRFNYIKQEKNIGSGKNIIFLCSLVDTEYTMIFAGHDVIEKSFVEKTLNIIQNNADVSFVFSKTVGINEKSELIDSKFATQSYNFTGNSVSRYIQSVRELVNCTLYQSVFRTKFLKGFSFPNDTLGEDHIFISRLLWYGRLHTIDEVLYKRRFFSDRTSTSENRVSGPHNEIKNNHYRMYEAYLDDFNKLYTGPNQFRNFLNNKILDILTHRFGISHTYLDDKDFNE